MGVEKYSSYDVLNAFFDDGSFFETDAFLKGESGEAEAVTGYGTVDGVIVYAFIQNVDNCGGAMSKAQSKKITKLYDLALKTGAPVIGFYHSIGGRLEQKYELLSAYGEILRKSSKLSGIVPQISVILGNCIGTAALIAAAADYIIMEKDASLCVDTTGENTSAQVNLTNGIASFICEGYEACVEKAQALLGYFPANNLDHAPVFEPVPVYDEPDKLPQYFADESSLLCVGGGYGEPVCTAFGRVNGNTVGVIVTKGGVISAEGARKMAKHVRFCDAFSIPLITIVDAEKFEDLSSASKLISAYADATAPKIAVISGTAVGAVYIALAGSSSGADLVYALADAVVSPVAPKAAAFILDSDIADAPVAEQDQLAMDYVKANLTAVKAAEDGYIDDIVDTDTIRDRLIGAIEILMSKRVSTLPKKHTTKV